MSSLPAGPIKARPVRPRTNAAFPVPAGCKTRAIRLVMMGTPDEGTSRYPGAASTPDFSFISKNYVDRSTGM